MSPSSRRSFLVVLALAVAVGWSWSQELVGVAKFVAHPALDALEKGIVDELRAARPGIAFDLQNANADMGTAAQIARRFKDGKAALVIGIATPTAQALAGASGSIRAGVADPGFVEQAQPWLDALALWGQAVLAALDLASARLADRPGEAEAADQRIDEILDRVHQLRGVRVPHSDAEPAVADGVVDEFVARLRQAAGQVEVTR